MTIKQKRRRQLGTPANIAASAFNLPIMVILGVYLGSLLSNPFDPPLREFVLILTILVFFIIAIIEIYTVAQYQTKKDALLASRKQKTLSDLILENDEGAEVKNSSKPDE
ncbi:MAG: hypothetical protein ACW97Z_09345 [Candidatus Hodarchaeales archaeon]|jgi:hypothetical protein